MSLAARTAAYGQAFLAIPLVVLACGEPPRPAQRLVPVVVGTTQAEPTPRGCDDGEEECLVVRQGEPVSTECRSSCETSGQRVVCASDTDCFQAQRRSLLPFRETTERWKCSAVAGSAFYACSRPAFLDPEPAQNGRVPVRCGDNKCDLTRAEVCCDESNFDGIDPVCKATRCQVRQLCFDGAPCPIGYRCGDPRAKSREHPGYGECIALRSDPIACRPGLNCPGDCCVAADGTARCGDTGTCPEQAIGCRGSADCGSQEQCCATSWPTRPPHTWCRGSCGTATSVTVCQSDDDCFQAQVHSTSFFEESSPRMKCEPEAAAPGSAWIPLRTCR